MNSKQYMAGENLTFVDFSIFELLDHMNYCSKGKTLSEHTNLRDYFARMQQLPGFKEFYADDEKCQKTGWKPWFATFSD